MTRETLQNIFRNPYSLDVWQNLLINLFGASEIRKTPAEIESDKHDKVSGYLLGELNTTDHYRIGLFAFEVGANTHIEMNRVGLRSLVRSYTKYQYDAAISVYYNDKQWRLSFISDLKGENTSPKRFTYVFGNEVENYRTAAGQLIKLYNTKPTFESIKDAFSVEKLSKDFFAGYKKQYDKFVGSIGDNKPNRDYVKKMMGRLVFLQFLQKKGWMGVPAAQDGWFNGDLQYTQNLAKRYEGDDKLLTNVLEVLFFDTLNSKRTDDIADPKLGDNIRIPYLNGGLFDKDTLDKKDIDFPYSYFAELLEFFSHYNFTIDENDPYDAEVGIDPEMLGHIFENLLEDNKDKGAFYTPKEIVQYMCRQSLIEYLQSKLGKHDSIAKLINQHDRGDVMDKGNFVAQNAAEIRRLLDEVKICDPAIGSGAFPMGLLNEIYHTKLTLNSELTAKRAEVKKNIIQNSIYGVDIEQGAVDIARLRFWLSLVVDEDTPQPLPNLDYKIMCGNSLIPTFDGEYIELNRTKGKNSNKIKDAKRRLTALQNEFYSMSGAKKIAKEAEIKRTILSIIELQLNYELESSNAKIDTQGNMFEEVKFEKRAELTAEYGKQRRALNLLKTQLTHSQIDARISDIEIPFFDWEINFSDVFDGENGGFDIVIANPPYVSTKGISTEDKATYQLQYGFADDLYYHFVVKGFDLLSKGGVITMITPDTYFTTLTKKNLRRLLLQNTIHSLVHLGHDVFEEAMVSTAIFVGGKCPANSSSMCVIDARGKNKLSNSLFYKYQQQEYEKSINGSFFVPNKVNLRLNDSLCDVHQHLIKEYWTKIETAREISRNALELAEYRNNLKAGDWTLIGLVTEGGQGLATANNGKFVGVRENTKEALRIKQTRIQKLAEVNKKHKADYQLPDDELEIWDLFETIKEKYGRDVFGQGYLYKIVPLSLIADVDTISDDEKLNGIVGDITFAPYDKGDKDGNRWYLETPFVIDWSSENVLFLKSNSGKKGKGMPVVRNPQFYFKEGFCYSDIKTFFIRCRLKGKSVYDVKSMSLFPMIDIMPAFYIISIINSRVIAQMINSFMNNTPSFQINDCRAIPIPVPSEQQLSEIKVMFDEAVSIQKMFFAKQITELDRDDLLEKVQAKIDQMVYALYNLTHDEINLIENR